MQVRFGAVTSAEVRGALKATGSTDPDVLLAAREEFASRYRPLKWMGIWAMVSGALATALVLTAFIGIPLFFVGLFWLRRAGRNQRTIEAAFAEHLAAVRGEGAPLAGPTRAPLLQALGAVALSLALPAGLAAQNDAALPEWVGQWGPKGSCAGPLTLVVAPKQVTLVNGKDKATEGNLTVAASYFGASYQGIMLVLLADWDKRQPFIVTFNAGEKPGDAVVEFSDAALQKRFPFTPTTVLRKCAGKAVGAAPAATKPVCGGEARCIEVTPFAATITDFRVSKAGGNDKIISFTVRFQNKTQAPLILGYVQQSGLVLDDQGVRFGAYGPNALRGIGTITGSTFDPKFVLQPGETGDARVEVASRTQPGTIFGTVYDAEFAVREIEPLPGDQYQLGREHLLQWKGLTPAATAAAAGAGAAGAAGAAAPTAAGAGAIPASPEGDACSGAPRCYGAGPFTASVTQVTTSKSGGYQTMRLAVKVRNVSAEPMILGFKSGSQTATDDVGDRLRSKNDGVRGIGLVASSSADPQFRLAPGQERGFTLDYFKGIYKGTVLGTTWGADFVLTQLEILPSQQVRTVRDHAIGFTELRGGGGATAGGNAGSDAAAVVNTLGRLIKKK